MPSVNCKGMSFEKSMRIFRRKVEKAGIKDRIREKQYYEKPASIKNDTNNYRKRKRKLDKKKEHELDLKRRLVMRHGGR